MRKGFRTVASGKVYRTSGKINKSQAIDAEKRNGALNSAVECHLHTVEVIGSNPIAPTTPEMPEGKGSTVVEFQGWKFTSFCLLQDTFVVTSACLQ